MDAAQIAVLLMAYGTPRTREDIEPYYTDIRRGRAPDARAARRPHRALRSARRHQPAGRAHRGTARRAAGGARRGRTRPLPRRASASSTPSRRSRPPSTSSPRRASAASSGSCSRRTTRRSPSASTSSEPPPRPSHTASPCAGIESWATEPAFVRVHRRTTCAPSWPTMPAEHQGAVHRPLAAAAHHRRRRPLPRRAARHRRGRRRRGRPRPLEQWAIAWQSAGRTPEPWLGPDILQVIDELADAENDAERTRRARSAPSASSPTTSRCCTTSTSRQRVAPPQRGIAFARTACVNDDPRVMAALARRVIEAASSMTAAQQRVAVVGGGIAGLAAAHALVTAPQTDAADVVVFERDDRLGGKLRTSPFAGHPAHRRGRRRIPGPPAVGHRRWLPRSASATNWSRPHAARQPCGGTRCTPSPRVCCWACPPTCSRSPARGCCRGRASCAPRPNRSAGAPRSNPTRSGSFVRARFGERGALPPGRPAGRQHLRGRHRPLQPGRGPADRRPRRPGRAACCSPAGSMPKPAPTAGPVFYAPARGHGRARGAPPRPRSRRPAASCAPTPRSTELDRDGQRLARQRRALRRRACSPAPPRAAAQLLVTAAPDGRRRRSPRFPRPTSRSCHLASPRRDWPEPSRWHERLPGAQADAAAGHRRVVRIAEVGALGHARRGHAAHLAGPRRPAGAAPLRRATARRGGRRGGRSTSASRCSRSQPHIGSPAGQRRFPQYRPHHAAHIAAARADAARRSRARRRQLSRHRRAGLHPLGATSGRTLRSLLHSVAE